MSSTNQSEPQLTRVLRSDNLVHMSDLVRGSDIWPLIAKELVRVYAIIDANKVYDELRWRLCKRQKSAARTALQEALDAEILVLFAPLFLQCEISKHLPRLASEAGVSLQQATDEWNDFQKKIHFFEPRKRPAAGSVRDPKDLPYQYASEDLGLPIYTKDPDLPAMGAPVLWVCIDMALRDHARGRSVTIGVTLGSTWSLTFGMEAFMAASRLAKKTFKQFSQLPTWAQVAIAAVPAALLIHPKSRAKIVDLFKKFGERLWQMRVPLLELCLALASELAAAQSKGDGAKEQIVDALPRMKKGSALVYARRACVLAGTAVSLREIVRSMRDLGYSSKAKSFDVYLRRKLRESGEFVETSPNCWQLSSAS